MSIHSAQLSLQKILYTSQTSFITNEALKTRIFSISLAFRGQVNSHSIPQCTDFKPCLKMRKGQNDN